MGGKKYPKKDGSEGSGKSQGTSTSSSSGGQPQSGVAQVRQRLQQVAISEQQSSSASGQQQQQNQPRPQQKQQRQNNPPAQAQGQGQGRGQRPQQQQQQQQQQQGQGRGQRPQQQQQQQPQGQGQGRGQRPQQQQQQLQQQGQGRGQRPQQQQQHQQQQQQGAWSQPKDEKPQQQRGDRGPRQNVLPRSESVQSVHSEKSQQSASSSGSRKPQSQQMSPMPNVPGLLVKYKGHGTRGRQLGMVETNYLELFCNKMVANAYHYDVKMEPDRPKKLLTMVWLKFKETNFPSESIAFDGTNNAYASAPLKIGDLQREIEIVHPETQSVRKFIVSIQEAKDSQIPIKDALKNYTKTSQKQDPKRAMQAIEVILKSAFHQPHLAKGIQGGRSFFLPPSGRREYLGDFYELWLGLFQSLVFGEMPLLNVDVNHKAFPKRYNSFLDLLRDMENDLRMQIDINRPLDFNVTKALERHLGGLEICYTNSATGGKRIYKFMSIDKSPGELTFTLENGERTNVLNYFRNSGRPIRYPNLPCIKLGNSIKNQSVPMEFCSIPDTQVINKKCTENQTRTIIKFAATSTDVRKQKIMDLLNQIKHNQSKTIQGFGLNLGNDFVKAPARLLDAPKIQYAANKVVQPQRGVWSSERMEFLITDDSKVTWGILNTSPRTRPNEVDELARMLTRGSATTGLHLADQPIYKKSVSDRNLRDISNELENIGKKGEIRILFCIIPDSGPTYAKIKQMAEIDHGVLTQCIKGNTVFRKRNDLSTISNILLKVNAKLNGTNHKLQSTPILTTSKCMVIGADVTHPSPEQTKIPSVVGVAASHDQHAFTYNICWRLQGQRKEMIEDFKTIMKEHLQFFKKKNGFLPEKILYYRDGVSEGQFDQVMAIERNDMMQACREIEPGYEKKVQMTIVVVQKRHHTRLFPGKTEIGKGDRKNNNVPAGTIVDTVITRPNENHFYLVSHQSIQGVAKPTKYCILLDEGNHSIDDLQGLTYNLCHLFSRCNRAVSYPAPTYYAHLAAYRGRVYIENERLNMNNLQREWENRLIKDNIIKGHPMYFV